MDRVNYNGLCLECKIILSELSELILLILQRLPVCSKM